jgi:DNA-binding transcriptional LysR family regulator
MPGTNLNLLVALQALLEEANVTRAAERLGLSQPAASSTLARLRERFGDELLVRDGRNLVLTPFAEDLLPELRETLRLIELTFRSGEAFEPRTSTHRFTVAMSDYAIAVIHEPLYARIAELAPHVTIAVESFGPRAGAERGLLDVDVLVGPSSYGVRGISRPLWKDRLVAIMDADNPARQNRPVSLETLASFPHAATLFGDGASTAVDRAFEERGIERTIRMHVSGWLPLAFAVQGTDLVAVMPERLARVHEAPSGRLTVVPLSADISLVERYWYAPHRRSSVAHQWLFAQLDAVASELTTLTAAETTSQSVT